MKHPLYGTTAVAGVSLKQYKRGASPLPERSVLVEAIVAACDEAGFDPADVDGFVSYGDDRNEPVRLMPELGMKELRWSSTVWGGGGGGIAGAFGIAAAAILTGQATAVVVFRALVEGQSGRMSAAVMAHHLNDHLLAAGVVSPAQVCAIRAKRLFEYHGVSPAIVEELVRASYHHGSRNPEAVSFGQEFDIETLRRSRLIAEPFRLFDCSRENDGAGALLLVSAERARDLRKPPVYMLGCTQGTEAGWGDLLENETEELYATAGFRPVARRLYGETGLAPSDIDVVQLYENFDAQGIMSLIDHGFCDYETAEDVIRFENLIADGGRLPINTSGGNLAQGFIHGIGLPIEAVRQLRGGVLKPGRRGANLSACGWTGRTDREFSNLREYRPLASLPIVFELEQVMREALKLYIDGAWVDPITPRSADVINPATEQPVGRVTLGSEDDVNRAVAAARRAFTSFGRSTRQERIELLEAVIEQYRLRRADVAAAITAEMGAPAQLADKLHGAIGHIHLKIALNVLKDFPFSEMRGSTRIMREPIGVCGLITPWNWPINQIAAKVAPALATGCTMTLKPSELSPFSAQIWAEVFHAAGVPAGVFNMVQGDGPTVGAAIAAHPHVDMVSFTGSTRAGVEVARAAAGTVKRVHQELGGKSPNILLPDADVGAAAAAGFRALVTNAGQSCNAPTRMLVPNERLNEALDALRAAAGAITVGDPLENPDVGPVVSRAQFEKIQRLIEKGVAEGATLVAGGPGRPEGLERGYYVKPTIFADVTNDMTIAKEEIFGPVLCVIGYDSVDEAVEIANDSEYGLAGYTQGKDDGLIADVASRLRVGQVLVNHPHPDGMAPFGGYKQSGNGREWGDHGFEAFLEVKAVLGAKPHQETSGGGTQLASALQ